MALNKNLFTFFLKNLFTYLIIKIDSIVKTIVYLLLSGLNLLLLRFEPFVKRLEKECLFHRAEHIDHYINAKKYL